MNKITALGLLVSVLFAPFIAKAAHYELGTPFPVTCEGILAVTNGIYSFSGDVRSDTDENQIACVNATIAERKSKTALGYTLKEKAIERLLSACSVGQRCRIAGMMNGLSHDVFFFVRLDNVSPVEDQ